MNIKRSAALIIAAAMLAACAAPAESLPEEPKISQAVSSEAPPQDKAEEPSPEKTDDTVYEVFFWTGADDGSTTRMNSDGELIEYEERTELYDKLTGELVAYTVTEVEDTGRKNEYGDAITETYTSLYLPDGTLVKERDTYAYSAGYAGLLVRHVPVNWMTMGMDANPIDSGLWDIKTGEVVVDKVMDLYKLGNGRMLATDSSGRVLGTLDENAKPLHGFPMEKDYFYPSVSEKGYIVLSTYNPYGPSDGKGKYMLYNADLEFIGEYDSVNVSYIALYGPYATFTKDGQEGVLSLETAEPVYMLTDEDDRVTYFDGEVMILQNGRPSTQTWRSTLCKADGTPLTTRLDRIVYYDTGDRSKPVEYFFAQKGDTVSRLSRTGEVEESVVITGINWISTDDSGFIYYTVTRNGRQRYGVLDKDLNNVISAFDHDYDSIYRLDSYTGGKRSTYDVLACYRTIGSGDQRVDLRRPDGSLIIDSLTTVGTIGENRIAVIRGFSVGLIDHNGEWVAKHSVYNTINVD